MAKRHLQKTFEINTLYVTKPNKDDPVLILLSKDGSIEANLHLQFINTEEGTHTIQLNLKNINDEKFIATNRPITIDIHPNDKNIAKMPDNINKIFGELTFNFGTYVDPGEKGLLNIEIVVDNHERSNIGVYIQGVENGK